MAGGTLDVIVMDSSMQRGIVIGPMVDGATAEH